MITFRYFPAPTARHPGDPKSEIRTISPTRVYYGTCLPWYPRPQILLEGICQDRKASRTFAVARIHPAPCPNGPHCKPTCLLCSGLNRLPLQILALPADPHPATAPTVPAPILPGTSSCWTCPHFRPTHAPALPASLPIPTGTFLLPTQATSPHWTWYCENIDASAAWIDATTGATNGRMPNGEPPPIPEDVSTCPGFPREVLREAP